ncbi:NUDIX hydrolase [Sporichthya polymorpha]|uniref:NUDIX hydrolase n=1 Tax=Sporichthya polymorpha TaxID=35751 RepID=UPI0003703ED4|nr:NUDIX domain-containing protein [Sporichthya polymorpha]
MGRRIDYLDDDAAPPANSMVPSVNVAVADANGRLLAIQRSDNGNWALPGGAIDLGESLTQAAIRETEEETGVRCEITGLVGIYTNPRHVIHYTSNDEVRQEFSIVVTARPVLGEPTPSSESTRVEWIEPQTFLDQSDLHPSMRARIEDYLAGPEAWPRIA